MAALNIVEPTCLFCSNDLALKGVNIYRCETCKVKFITTMKESEIECIIYYLPNKFELHHLTLVKVGILYKWEGTNYNKYTKAIDLDFFKR